MKKFLLSVLAAIILLLAILFFNYLTVPSLQITVEEPGSNLSTIVGAEGRIAESIRFQTISYEDSANINYEPFIELHQFFEESFPLIYENLEVETVSEYSLLYRWKGQNSNLKPAVIIAHIDVVPVSEDTRDLWSVAPFEGIIQDGYLWGRGTVDNKINVMGQLEAVHFLLSQNYRPQRDIYIAFGHDEEIGGYNGALQIAKLLHSRGIEAEFVLDEGGFITNTMVPGVGQPVALIGTSEKGNLDLTLSLRQPGGHSSMPEKENAIRTMSRAISDLTAKPFKPGFSPSVKEFIAHIAPHSSFINRLAMSNLWLFKPVVYNIYSQSAAGDALIRTTMVSTIIQGGEKSNVVPDVVTATVNYRLTPGTSIEDVVAHTKKAINNPLIEVKISGINREATGVSPIDTDAFRLISEAIHKNFENTLVAPFLMIAGTDSRHYDLITPNIYKFSPMIDPAEFHGVDERLRIGDYPQTIGFYVDLMKGL